jgi:hypothetical protein
MLARYCGCSRGHKYINLLLRAVEFSLEDLAILHLWIVGDLIEIFDHSVLLLFCVTGATVYSLRYFCGDLLTRHVAVVACGGVWVQECSVVVVVIAQ